MKLSVLSLVVSFLSFAQFASAEPADVSPREAKRDDVDFVDLIVDLKAMVELIVGDLCKQFLAQSSCRYIYHVTCS